jgi:hypothetical protein
VGRDRRARPSFRDRFALSPLRSPLPLRRGEDEGEGSAFNTGLKSSLTLPFSLKKGRGDPDSANTTPRTQSVPETISYFV